VNEDAVKTSAGALLRIPVCRVESLTDTAAFLKNSGVLTIACHEKGEKPYYEADLKIPLAIVTGSENTGISPAVLEAADSSIHIPMSGDTSSLNVSVATAIILFDAARQRSM
jgi:23S rRNA (guanosine2251-2'-O)-methyltransferase